MQVMEEFGMQWNEDYAFLKRSGSKKWRLPKGSGFYAALALAVVAVGMGVWGAVNNGLRQNPYLAATSVRSTINWEHYLTRAQTEATLPVNRAATSVADPRGSATTNTAVASTSLPENKPFVGSFALPFGTNISKDYSNGEVVKAATMGDWRVHNAVDFAGEADSTVLAIQSGKVIQVEEDPMWGVCVTVDHGEGVEARYCGLTKNTTPEVGKSLKKGEALGVVGIVPCESTEGVHLHLEIMVNQKAADPLAVMNKSGN